MAESLVGHQSDVSRATPFLYNPNHRPPGQTHFNTCPAWLLTEPAFWVCLPYQCDPRLTGPEARNHQLHPLMTRYVSAEIL